MFTSENQATLEKRRGNQLREYQFSIINPSSVHYTEMLSLKEMNGENQIDQFKAVGAEIVKRLSRHKSVVGALFTGGIIRGFADNDSDVDVLLFLEHEDDIVRSSARSLAKEIERRFSIETDIEIHVPDAYMQLK